MLASNVLFAVAADCAATDAIGALPDVPQGD